jgi:predicted NAD/FAD-binding protein
MVVPVGNTEGAAQTISAVVTAVVATSAVELFKSASPERTLLSTNIGAQAFGILTWTRPVMRETGCSL